MSASKHISGMVLKMPLSREFKQITTAGAATAIVVEEAWGEYVAVVRQSSTLSSANYKPSMAEKFKTNKRLRGSFRT